MGLLPLILSVVLGVFWTYWILSPCKFGRDPFGAMLIASLGAGFGVGILSCVFYLLLVLNLALAAVLAIIELIVLAAGGFLVWRSPASQEIPLQDRFPWTWLLAIAFVAGAGLLAAAFTDASQSAPYGQWDAWGIWNLRAKFLAAGGGLWKNAVSPLLKETHPEYPLLTSGSIAAGWLFSGGDYSTAVPIAHAALFTCCVFLLLVSALAIARGRAVGLVSGLVLLASTIFLGETSTQYADVPLSYFMLGAVSLAVLSEGNPNWRRLLALAGAFASFAAWAKNEGLAFLVIAAALLFVTALAGGGLRSALDRIEAFILGALPCGLIVVGFRLFVAPATDPLFHQSGRQMAQKLVDGARYSQIASAFGRQILEFGDSYTHPLLLLIILVAALKLRKDGGTISKWLPAGVVVLMLAAYFSVFLLTPADLEWHLSTALQRLIVQVWPALILAVLIRVRRPEDWATKN